MTQDYAIQSNLPVSNGLSGLKGFIQRRVVEPLRRRSRRRAAIAALSELNDRMLADIGISRGEIAQAVDGEIYRRDLASKVPMRRHVKTYRMGRGYHA